MVRQGDHLHIVRGDLAFDLTIDDVSDKRGPAKKAVTLYTESAESIRKRELLADEKRLERKAAAQYGGRPDKQGRRNLRRLQGKD
jgi:ribosome-associated heat shock protein Hsp15